MKINVNTDLIINGDYEKLLNVDTRAINLTGRSRAKIKKNFELAEKGMKRLEERKEEFSKSPYAVEHGSVERIEQRMEKLQVVIIELEDKLTQLKKEKPIRLSKVTFSGIMQNAAAFWKIPKLRKKQKDKDVEDQKALQEINDLIDQNVEQIQAPEQTNIPVESPVEETLLPSIVDEQKTVEAVVEKQLPAVVEEKKLDPALETVAESKENVETKEDGTIITRNEKEIIYEFPKAKEQEKESTPIEPKTTNQGSIESIMEKWNDLNNLEAEVREQNKEALEEQKKAEATFIQITKRVEEAVISRQAVINQYKQETSKAKDTTEDIYDKINQLQQMLESTLGTEEVEKADTPKTL